MTEETALRIVEELACIKEVVSFCGIMLFAIVVIMFFMLCIKGVSGK